MQAPFNNIVFIGAGKLVYHLSKWMYDHDCNILQVVNRDIDLAKRAAVRVDSSYGSLDEISSDGDLYIISLADDAYSSVLEGISLKGKILAHTSGITTMSILGKSTDRPAVFYPLQTFSAEHEPEFKDISLCIEASNPDDLQALEDLAVQLRFDPHQINTEQRQLLHLAATIACNFSNAMYGIADKLLKEHNVDFKLLLPLIEETAQKIKSIDPVAARTGPAVRNDILTVEKHISMLRGNEKLKNLYLLLSEMIVEMGNNNSQSK